MEGINIIGNNNNGFYASIRSNIVLLVKLFFDTSLDKEKESYDKNYILNVKEKIELWLEVSLNMRLDFNLNTNHPLKYDFKGKEIILYAKNGSQDKILRQVFELYELVEESLKNETNIQITKSND